MKKTYVLDTNVLLSDSNSIFSFEDNDLIIPMAVLEELDRHKSRLDEVGKGARQISRSLDELRTKGSLTDGVSLTQGGTLRIVSVGSEWANSLPQELQTSKTDNMIIALMFQLRHEGKNCILVSKDINVRIKCDSLGIKCEDYLKMRVTANEEQFYRGVEVLEVPERFQKGSKLSKIVL
jgi:PhoH-like ATPase